MEVRSAGKVTAVDNRTDVRPFGVHGTGGVNDKGQLNFSATGVVPSDLNVVVGVDNHIGVALVADDGRQQGVIKQGDNGARADVGLNHGVVDLGLVEKSTKFVVVVLPDDVNVVLAVDVKSGPVSVLRTT